MSKYSCSTPEKHWKTSFLGNEQEYLLIRDGTSHPGRDARSPTNGCYLATKWYQAAGTIGSA